MPRAPQVAAAPKQTSGWDELYEVVQGGLFLLLVGTALFLVSANALFVDCVNDEINAQREPVRKLMFSAEREFIKEFQEIKACRRNTRWACEEQVRKDMAHQFESCIQNASTREDRIPCYEFTHADDSHCQTDVLDTCGTEDDIARLEAQRRDVILKYTPIFVEALAEVVKTESECVWYYSVIPNAVAQYVRSTMYKLAGQTYECYIAEQGLSGVILDFPTARVPFFPVLLDPIFSLFGGGGNACEWL